MIKKELIYWDACAFIAWFKPDDEPENAKKCLGTIEEAKEGNIKIVTSAITLTEVIKLKYHKPLLKEDEEIIKSFFENKFIQLINLDRWTAEAARCLIWKYPHLHPKDSIHVASAVKNKISILHSFDAHLLKLNGKIENLKITEPDIKYVEQKNLDLALSLEN